MALADARIFHVNLNCASLERSRQFYVEALGLSEGVRTQPEHAQPGAAFGFDRAWWDAWILVADRGFEGGAIDLLEWREPSPSGSPPARYHECGFQRVGLAVPDLDGAIERASTSGGHPWSEPIVHGGPPGPIRLVHMSDPDGIALELFEGGSGLSFISIVCADLARSLAWYKELGFREVARFPTRAPDGAFLHIDGPVESDEVLLAPAGGGSVHLILVGFTTPRPSGGAKRALNTLGIARVALLVPDIDAAFAELTKRGISSLSEPVSSAMGPGLPELRFVCFAGPDGEILELIEQPG